MTLVLALAGPFLAGLIASWALPSWRRGLVVLGVAYVVVSLLLDAVGVRLAGGGLPAAALAAAGLQLAAFLAGVGAVALAERR